MRCVTVVIADQHPIVLEGLKNVLGTQHDFKVVASCSDGAGCICESAPSLNPFRRRMLTLPYRPIIVCAECLSNRAPGSLLETDWGSNATPIDMLRTNN